MCIRDSDTPHDMTPLFDAILRYIPAPEGDPDAGTQLLISTIDYNEYVGRIGIGKVDNGKIAVNQEVLLMNHHDPDKKKKVKVSKLYEFDGLNTVSYTHLDVYKRQDTGFSDGRKCACFRRTETELLYGQSNLREVLKEDNFEHFSLDYYSDEIVSESSGLTARQTAAFALKCARDFVAGFSEDFSNLCLYGDTGVGKTFLSHCIARDLIEAGFSVLYLTSFELFEQLEPVSYTHLDVYKRQG